MNPGFATKLEFDGHVAGVSHLLWRGATNNDLA